MGNAMNEQVAALENAMRLIGEAMEAIRAYRAIVGGSPAINLADGGAIEPVDHWDGAAAEWGVDRDRATKSLRPVSGYARTVLAR
jgi:hypothetical protein